LHDPHLAGDRLMTTRSNELESFKQFSDVCRAELRKYSTYWMTSGKGHRTWIP